MSIGAITQNRSTSECRLTGNFSLFYLAIIALDLVFTVFPHCIEFSSTCTLCVIQSNKKGAGDSYAVLYINPAPYLIFRIAVKCYCCYICGELVIRPQMRDKVLVVKKVAGALNKKGLENVKRGSPHNSEWLYRSSSLQRKCGTFQFQSLSSQIQAV